MYYAMHGAPLKDGLSCGIGFELDTNYGLLFLSVQVMTLHSYRSRAAP